MAYYDGTKLLSLRDLDGEKPEIYIVDGNRTGGKTTFFSKFLVNKFLKYKEKFMLIYRFNYELDDVADKFFKDIKGLFFPDWSMISETRAKGIYHELFLVKELPNPDNEEEPILEKISCGYAVSLNSSDILKKYSHIFSDTKKMLFDEFQSENNHYCSNEVRKFLSLHTSVARGQGEQVRYVPVYMLSNATSLLNPYYVEMGITKILREDTKFLRGRGWVMERNFNETSAEAQKSSGVNKAFSNNSYISYSIEGSYLNDSQAFIENLTGSGTYICTLTYKGRNYGIRLIDDGPTLYCDDKPDLTFNLKIVVDINDHNKDSILLDRYSNLLTNFRRYYEQGHFRFKDLMCKEAILNSLAYAKKER